MNLKFYDDLMRKQVSLADGVKNPKSEMCIFAFQGVVVDTFFLAFFNLEFIVKYDLIVLRKMVGLYSDIISSV